jgi:hypothetical protein
MCWTNLLHLSKRIATFACLIALLCQCTIDTIDKLPSELLTLSKGQYLADPVVQTAPISVSTIVALKNIYDTRMAPQFKVERPKTTSAYNGTLVESISLADLPNHAFQWRSTKQSVMMVALFNQTVQVSTNEISNKEALVWFWVPPKGSIDPGVITYKDGQRVIWDTATEKYIPESQPLNTARYVWCVLAWDKQGINIIAASRELPIQITP